jgi:hypothetical protein
LAGQGRALADSGGNLNSHSRPRQEKIAAPPRLC